MFKKNNTYSREFKIKVVKKYLEGNISFQEIADKFSIKSKTQVYNWVIEYKNQGTEAFKFENRGRSKEKKNYNIEFEEEEELELLRMENDYLKKLCKLLKSKLKKED